MMHNGGGGGHDPSTQLPTVPAPLVAAFEYHGAKLRVRKGQIIVSERDASSDVYYIQDGAIQFSLFGAQGREMTLRILGSGEIFGEIAALAATPRSSTAIANEGGTLIRICGDMFRHIIQTLPGAGLWLSCHLAGQMRSLTEKVQELSMMPVGFRLVSELLRMVTADANGGGVIAPFPTHAALAARIGSQREPVSRELSALTRAGLLEQKGRRMIIPSIAALHKINDPRIV